MQGPWGVSRSDCAKTRESRHHTHRLGLPFRVLSPTRTPAGASPRRNPLGVWAPTTHTGMQATCRVYLARLQPPGDSSPPWRHSSRKPFRPCCMPERPWGFPFKAFPPEGAVPVSRSMLSCRYGNPFLSSLLRLRREPGESIGFRALLTSRIRACGTNRNPYYKPMPSWGSASLGCSPLRPPEPQPRTSTHFSNQHNTDGGRRNEGDLCHEALAIGG